MIYDIRLKLHYGYGSGAGAGRHLVRVTPRDLAGQQRVVASLVTIAPTPDERQDGRDFFGNATVGFAFRSPHAGLEVTMQARVDRMAAAAGQDRSVPLARLAADLAACRDLGPDAPLHGVASSARVPLLRATSAFARAALQPGQSAQQAVLAVGRALHRHMTFDAKATTVDTPLAEAFEAGKGVCQDYSHILIACLRGIGIPAGYVSGFLRTTPPAGQARLEGADAMHAWVRAWCGARAGWVEYDPTNDCLAGADHVVVAYGRDYSDVAPIKGSLRIAGGHKGDQSVDMIPVEAPVAD